MAKKTSRSRKTTASSRSRASRRRSASLLKKIGTAWNKVPRDRQLDIIGFVLVVLGLILLIGFITGKPGSVTEKALLLLYQIAGIGAVLMPIVLLVIGGWLIFRVGKKMPAFSTIRLLGIVLLLFNILTWMHWISGGGWDLAKNGSGGGYLGAVFERLLDATVGFWGVLITLIAWSILAVVLLFDISVPELIRRFQDTAVQTGSVVVKTSKRISRRNKKTTFFQQEGLDQETAELRGFTPIAETKESSSEPSKQVPAKRGKRKPLKKGELGQPQIEIGVHANAEDQPWQLPKVEEILNRVERSKIDERIDQERARLIEETLASFGAPVHVVEIHRGPTFTQFGVKPDFVQSRTGRMRVRVSKIASLADDLALALAASRVRVQAPVPGRRYVGIEVPNAEIDLVTLREGMLSKSFQRLRSTLRIVLGQDVAGKPVAVDLPSLPHLLIAGTTGSGKSVCINSIICGLLMQRTPSEMRFVMVDPKRVELTGYNGIPHLLTPVIVEPEKVISALQWMSREMDSRYKKFSEVGARNIEEYNHTQPHRLPYVVVVIDELADLMMLAPEETERNLNRLAQLARAIGIHLVIATQRPSVDVLTGMIKANFPARISFAVVSGIDSRVVLDQPGAERLIGRGDMLFQAPDAPAPKRLQGVFVSDQEIQRIVRFWRNQAEQLKQQVSPDRTTQEITLPKATTLTKVPTFDKAPDLNEDPLFGQAVEIIREADRASISLLQRKLRIGYTRAARMIDRMIELEIVGEPLDKTGVRPVLINDHQEEE